MKHPVAAWTSATSRTTRSSSSQPGSTTLAQPIRDPQAMTLATATATDRPSARVVLLRGLDEQRRHVLHEPHVPQGRRTRRESVRRRGRPLVGARAPGTDRGCRRADVRRRSRSSTGGRARAAASSPRGRRSSRVQLSGRDELEARVAEMEERFAGDDVPLPPFWGGYRLRPDDDRVLDAPRRPPPRPRALCPRGSAGAASALRRELRQARARRPCRRTRRSRACSPSRRKAVRRRSGPEPRRCRTGR